MNQKHSILILTFSVTLIGLAGLYFCSLFTVEFVSANFTMDGSLAPQKVKAVLQLQTIGFFLGSVFILLGLGSSIYILSISDSKANKLYQRLLSGHILNFDLAKQISLAWTSVHKTDKKVIAINLVVGLICHGFLLSNIIINWDGQTGLHYSSLAFVQYGRWFTSFLGFLSESTLMPFPFVAVSIVLMSVSGLKLAKLFNCQRTLEKVIVSALLISYPAFAVGLSYNWICYTFPLATWLGLVAIEQSMKSRISNTIGAIILTVLMLGTYQGHLSFLLCTLLVVLIKKDFQFTKRQYAHFAALAFASPLTYKAITDLIMWLTGFEYSDYLRGNEINSLYILEHFPKNFLLTYESVKLFFAGLYFSMPIYQVIAILGLIVFGVFLFVWKQLYEFKAKRSILLLAIALLSPSFIFATRYLNADIYALLTFGVVPILAGLFLFLSKQNLKLISSISYVLAFVIILGFINRSNMIHLKNHLWTETSLRMANDIAIKMAALEDFSPDKKLVRIGNLSNDKFPKDIRRPFNENAISMAGPTGLMTYGESTTMNGIMNFLGFNYQVASIKDLPKDILEQANEMKQYPEDGSIKVIGEYIIVKFD